MDRYCPECNATMTPSLVGYLCPNCGNMQRFHTQTATISPRIEVLPAGPSDAPEDPSKYHEAEKPDAGSNKVKSTLKRLMVPELSPPHHEQLIAGEGSDIPAQKADKLPKEFDTANTSSSTYKAYQPDQIADDFDPPEAKQPIKHSNAWLWATLVLFVVAAVGLGVIYFLYNR